MTKRKNHAGRRAHHYRKMAVTLLWLAQRGHCHICGEELPPIRRSAEISFDHVWPKAKVVSYDKDNGNILLAHAACNRGKADRLPTGCEIIMLHAANRFMRLNTGATSLWDNVRPGTKRLAA